MFRRKCTRRIIEIGPFEHQLHSQSLPGLRTVAHDDFKVREKPAHLVQMLHLLGFHRYARPRNAHIQANRNAKFRRCCIKRKHIFVVDRNLRQCAARKDANRRNADFAVQPLDTPDFVHTFVGVARNIEEEALRIKLFRAARCIVVIPSHQRLFDVETIHLLDRPFNEIARIAGGGHILEHILRRH